MDIEPQPPEWVIDLQIFEDNVKKGYARIKKHITEVEERLKTKRTALRRPQATTHDFREYTEEEAFCTGLCRALQHLVDTMGNESAFEDDYWDKHCNDDIVK